MLSSSPPLLSTSFLSTPKLTVSPNSPTSLRTQFHPLSAAAAATASHSISDLEQEFRNFTPQETMTSITSYYEVLGIPFGASGEEIKTAYRRLARTCHPDVAAMTLKNSSGDEFMKIQAAYSTLSDPEKRAVYDSKLLFRRRRPLTSSTVGFSGYGGRSWETDQCW